MSYIFLRMTLTESWQKNIGFRGILKFKVESKHADYRATTNAFIELT